MAYRGGSFARSLMSAARSSSFRSPSTLPRARPPLASPRLPSRRPSFATSRSMGEIGCTQSLLPLYSIGTRLTSHLTADVRACCELSHGTFRRSCQDR